MSKNLLTLKENTKHGSLTFPCACYHALSTAHKYHHPFHAYHHWHEEIEILYFEKGTFLLEVGMEKYTISNECFCFVNSVEMHALYSEEDYSEYAIVFLPSMLKFMENDDSQQNFILPLIKNELVFPRFLTPNDPFFHEILLFYKNIVKICEPDPLYIPGKSVPASLTAAMQLRIKANLLSIFACLAEADYFTTESPSNDRRIEVLKNSISYMKEHYMEKIYISDLSAIANMNEQYYCRFFKKAMGKSPIEYLNDMRIQRSMKLLQNSQKSVLDISLECGFNNLGNYMRTFKKITGLTPLQYRKSFLP